MLKGLIGKVVGDPNEREIRKLQPDVEAMNALEPDMERRTDAELGGLSDEFLARLVAGETPDDILHEAFAAVREVAKRTVDMRPFDVQLIGGMVLHQGKVAEMRTGEGKTLVATMPVYLNALLGRGVHLVTVNDYLARRDTLWMGPIYHLMGLSVGLLQSGTDQPAYLYDPEHQRDPYPGLRRVPRQEAYAAHVTYGTNNEFGFDYLRDNLALSLERRVQRPLFYAIVDEVDNIFIDEARTPLIISGASGEPVEEYSRFAAIARKLEQEVHYELDEKERSVFLTEEGLAIVEQDTGIDNIYDEANYRYVHYMQQALKAQVLFLEGRDYIRQRKRIVLVDQHTGRLMPSRRLSEGLHQAIEAKEGVPIRPRDVTSATVTIQNYFRMYEKLAGMSGTAETEGEEFFKIYSLDVLPIPTNKPVIRKDHADVVYRSEESKLRAVAREILDCHSRGQPVLVGTTSVEMSERLGKRLSGERLQMAALAPRVAYALQDADLDREERARLRETMNDSLETMNSAAWRRMVRALDLDPIALSDENLAWIGGYLKLDEDPATRRTMERALRDGIDHQILNAKEHTREASIIARAGQPGSVTIATNMAGRGVDIKLGGELSDEVLHKAHQVLRSRGLDPFTATPAQVDSAVAEVVPQYAKNRDWVLAAGGLHVLGTERHEARRIDNQLRGRSGRQGESGSSRFYLSLEDDLMRRFGRKEMLSRLMEQIGDDFPIEHNLVSRTLERAQTSVEGYNFDIRKHLLEYDDVLNRQRETIYDERLRILKSDNLRAETWRMLERQVDEYLEKHEEERDQRHLTLRGMDDIVPLSIPAPSGPFQGPLVFGGHLTAFPPFTISFLADQFAGQSLAQARMDLLKLARRAANDHGKHLGQTVGEITQTTQEKYEERLDRYRALLDEKIEDYLQLIEERGQSLDAQRLAQHLERTYPLRLTMPPRHVMAEMEGLDDLRDHWQAQVEIEFHRLTCSGILDRVQIRLPSEVRLDRLRPARIPSEKLTSELRRVLELAAKQTLDREGSRRLEQANLPTDPSTTEVLELLAVTKEASSLDCSRLDRLMGHVVGSYLDDLIDQYLEALGEGEGRVRRDLERIQASVVEGKKGGRTSHLLDLFRRLNDLVHIEIEVLDEALSLAVAHEYDKWAQRQLADIESDADNSPLPDTSWSAIAEHLLAAHYTQRQVYDRSHRRRTTWLPRLPFGFVGQAHVEALDTDTLREALLGSLRWALEQREQAWGRQELQRWGHYSLDDLGAESLEGLQRYLGEQEIGDLRESPVEALPTDLYNSLRFTLALRQWETQNLRVGDLPQVDRLLDDLGQGMADQLLNTPIGELDAEVQERIAGYLGEAGFLDSPEAQERLVMQPFQAWEQRTRGRVAAFLGQQFVEAHKDQSIAELPSQDQEIAISYLHDQRRFVDEEAVQRFLIHQQLTDLPGETQHAALLELARSRLDRLGKRKISNLDVRTRQTVTESLQRMGMFTDPSLRDGLLTRTLSELEPEIRSGFGALLARNRLGDGGLGDLDENTRRSILKQLQETDSLADQARLEGLGSLRLSEVDEPMGSQIRDDMLSQLRATLSSKTMEELPSELRHQVHRELDERDYFVDDEKVGWYERKTLALLASDLLRGLEQHLGQVRLAEVAGTPFRELPAETQGSLRAFFDREGLLSNRAERLRLVQSGTLDELSDGDLAAVALHLGRQWLVRIRDRRPPTLAEGDRRTVWSYLRGQGYFTDQFKEELFAYQRLDEFDAETQQSVEEAIVGQLASALDAQAIGELAPDTQTEVRARLSQAGYFVDGSRLRLVQETPVASLPSDLREAVEFALGQQQLSELGTTPINGLPQATRSLLWRYLDGIGYFVNEKARAQVLDRRLIDLGHESLGTVVADLAAHLKGEIGTSPVSELDEGLRQGLREALERLGYFVSDEVRNQVLAQPLADLRREDLETLASLIGRAKLDNWEGQCLADIPDQVRAEILSYLQAEGWFLDQKRLEGLQTRRLSDLESGLGQDLVDSLRLRQVDELRQQRLADLDRGQRHALQQALLEQGASLDTDGSRSLRSLKVGELEQEAYHTLLRDLGDRVLVDWEDLQFQNLEPGQQGSLSGYLGRRIMGRIERRVLLHTISRLWIDYLTDIEDLRRGIGLEAYGQRDPLVEYKRRAYELFEELGDNIRRTAVRSLFRQPPEPLDGD
jgi:preprotein translocase subunit SecA